MKKALSFAVALGLVAGFAATASAVTMDWAGDARWRGVYMNNTTDSADVIADKVQRMDQRYRMFGTLNINDDVSVSTRIILADNLFGNNQALNGDNDVAVDRAHMTINMLGGTYIIGRQNASWGNKFLGWGSQVDRLKAVYKSGDLTYGGYLQKNSEGDDVWGDGDSDTYAAFVVGNVGDTKWGVLTNYVYVDPTAVESSDGYLIDPFFTMKAGAATIMGELVYVGGDAMENSDGDAYYGGFIGGAVGMGAATIKGLVAYYAGNEGQTGRRDCDNDFAPSLLIGTCQETAVIDFGQTTGWTDIANPTNDATIAAANAAGRVAQADDTTYLVGVGVDFKVNDKLTLGALVGYLMASEYGGATMDQDQTLLEFDVTARYQIAQNASYHFGIAYAQVDEFSAADDDWVVIGNGIDVKW